MDDEDRTNLVTLLRWAADPPLPPGRLTVILVTANLADLHPHLRQASRIELIAIPLPDHATRRRYIEALLQENGFELGMAPDQLAQATVTQRRAAGRRYGCRRIGGLRQQVLQGA